MIGNDVVDILQSRLESNLHRRGFTDKLFSLQEQETIQQSPDTEQMTWRLWSMKEAAYKIYNRNTGIRAFMPLSLCCTVEGTYGKVDCNGTIYFTKTTITDGVVHTIAVCNADEFSLVYEPESFEVYKDDNGLPYVKNNGLVYPASISHHGKHLKIVGLKKVMKQAEI
jgi:phosphopantetheinyl transferase (holo-ACP synthase)